ncbi:MAG: hypothetical protein AAF614_15250 [Chloroflexota bacterium]
MIQRHPWFLDFALKIIIEGNKQIVDPIRTWRTSHGLEGRDPYFLRLAQTAAPEPMTAALILEREPYASADLFEQMLQETAVRGFLTAVSSGYQLTDKGHQVIDEYPQIYQAAAQPVLPLSQAKWEQLVTLLTPLVTASTASTIPHPILNRLLFYRFPADAPVFLHIREAIMALWGFRDDAHLASWQSLDISPIARETLSYLWQGEAKTAVSLAKKLQKLRGHDATAYAEALDGLAARGWACVEDGAFVLTENGRLIREQAEKETDDIFYQPWQALSPVGLETLEQLLAQFCQQLVAANR